MAMTAQEYLDTFNAAINAGAYDSAANILKAAEGDFGPGVYDVAGVVLESNASLPPEIDFMSPQGIQSIRDYVNTATAPPPAPPAVDPVAQQYVNDFNALINQGNYEDAAQLVKSAELAGYGEDAYRAAAVALDANTNLPPELNFLNAEGIASIKSFVEEATRPPPPPPAATVAKSFDEQLNELANQNFGRSLKPSEMDTYRTEYGGELNDANINDFLKRSQKEIDQVKTARDIATKAIDTAAANAEGRPGPDQIFGIPRFERQAQSNVPFAPLRRGLAQLRPAMYMPGLTSGQAPLGGSGFTPESLRNAIQSMTAAGQTPADVAYQMDVGGVSPAELSAAIGTPVGQIQAQYNQSRPGGLFSTGAPASRGLPEDFALQTGAYGAPTPTFFTPAPAKTTSLSESSSANANQPGSIGGDGSGGDGEGIEGDPNSSGFSFSGFGFGFGPDPSNEPSSGFTGSVSGVGSPGDDEGTGSPTGDFEVGGLIRMAESGGPPKMTELSAKEAGSTFDISKYIDDEGRLVGGYSKPIYDENRVITGYDYRPYERDVVFGEELRDKEAAMRLTDAEREQMMVEMAMRQGRTGIDPRVGGLAGIEIGDPMMRRRPQYYSTVEQFRPRYAEGGLANVAQNLADRGRKGDSMLVHMAPEEVAGLRALARAQGTDMTINPRTGLPEAFSLKKLFKAASFILPFVPIPGLFGMSSLLTKSIFSGIAAGASAKGGFDLKQALGGGLRAYALGSLGEKMGGAPTPDGAPTAPTTTSVPNAAAVDAAAVTAPTVTVPGVDGDISLAGSYTGPGSTPLGPQSLNANLTAPLKVGSSYGFQAATDVASAPIFEAPIGAAGGRDIPLTGGALPPGADTVPGRMANVITPEGQGFGKPITKGFDIAAAGLGGFSLEKAAEETRRAEIEAATVKQKEEERERLFEELARRTLGRVNVKSGGQINLAKGGMTYMEGGGTTDVTGEPRMVQGTGDGMSDSVPATIEGIQEARLANDEFVIPADVVADIGNGSSNAGAKKLYNAMDRIRKARHGTTKQPPEIRAERLMPA
jgi:hypothetical protein